MSLQFILGKAGSGKTRSLYEDAINRSIKEPDFHYLVIVPEQFTMQAQREMIRLHPRHGMMNIDVLSFKRLAYRVFDELNVRLPAVLDDMGKSMVLRRVMGPCKKELGLYGGHLGQPRASRVRDAVVLAQPPVVLGAARTDVPRGLEPLEHGVERRLREPEHARHVADDLVAVRLLVAHGHEHARLHEAPLHLRVHGPSPPAMPFVG